MDPVQKAIWFVEGHLGEDFGLEDVADVAGLSRHHMVRAFGQVTGFPVMRYVRARRLSEAARALAAGAPDILSVALASAYGSHEAFTRAFRDQFGVTPEQVRARGCLANLKLVEPIMLEELRTIELAPPRTVERGPMLLAGLLEHYRDTDMAAAPNQWQRFAPWIGHVPAQVGMATYGVVFSGGDGAVTDYLAAVEVETFDALPPELSPARLAAQTYAVFHHPGHISDIRAVWRTIWAVWVPERLKKLSDAPFLERYPETFDGMTGRGGFEIWLPVES